MINAKLHQDAELFGLPATRGRWLLIPLGAIALLCSGSVYAWSIFRTPLEAQFSIGATQSLLPYMVALIFYATLMPITGFCLPQVGTQTMMAIGGGFIAVGYLLSSLAGNIETMTFTYGVLAGTGVGITYGVPMVVVARWFPDRQGLAVGLTIVGFGLSPVVTAPFARNLINLYSVQPTLRILGIIFASIILLVAFALKMPPPNWHPPGKPLVATTSQSISYPARPLKSRSFYALWICYTIGTLVGLSAIGISSSVGEEIINIDPKFAAKSVSLFALFNGISRPLFGWLSDRFKPRYVAIASYTLIIIACVLMINAQSGQVATYLVAFCLFWFCLGGWLAIAPTTTLRFFNPERYPQTYGLIFTAYGVGALLGNLVTGQIRDWFGSYTYAFYLMGFLAVIGIVVASTLLKREHLSEAKGDY